MPRRLEDMAVVITGASGGIGRATAVQLAAAGAKLTLAARRVELLEQLNVELGGGHQVVPTDVARRDDCEALVAAAAAHHGRVDTVICNAGYGLARAAADTSAEQVRDLFQTNVVGTIDVVRSAVPILRSQAPRDGYRGQVVVVSSAVARRAVPSFGVYGATKAAQLSFCEALRVELRPEAIAVTSVHPVGTDTDFFDTAGFGGPGRRQSATTVARAIVRGVRRPRPEVWPLRPARWGLSLATLFPGLVDRALANYRRPTTEAK